MSPQILFQTHLVFGYVAWLLCFGVYVWPRLKSMDQIESTMPTRLKPTTNSQNSGRILTVRSASMASTPVAKSQ
jgi:hypothetical protein